ncbi:MAG: phosphate starvation-inducible protein PhoH [Paenibacillus sp.]|nr:phosphate starvation-inducible protein PhoH [Paenibacillus sp.]
MSANETADFVVLASGASFSEQRGRDGRSDPRTKVIDQYDLPAYDLLGAGHRFLVVDEFADQELLLKQRERIRAFLDQGIAD